MGERWVNWSGSVDFEPARVERPRDEEALARLVQRAAREGRHVRVVGAGHSSSDIVRTADTLVVLDRMKGLVEHDAEAGEAVIRGGTTIREAGAALLEAGLAMHNMGDVDVQTVAGAIAVGTHGTGRRLPNLSAMLLGGRLVTGTGDVVEVSPEDVELLKAARVSLGTLGIFTTLRLRVEPAYRLHRQEWCGHVEDCLDELDAHAEENRNFDFYWYPRSDEAKMRRHNLPGRTPPPIARAECVEDREGWVSNVLPKTRTLKFDEVEYMLPEAEGPAAFRELRELVKEKHRREVAWRTLYRTIAPDDAFLSPCFGRQTVAVSCHHNAGLPYREYFADAEAIFLRHGGRPHWGKKHTLTAAQIRPLYPEWNRFHRVRARLDPHGVFFPPEMRRLLDPEALPEPTTRTAPATTADAKPARGRPA